MLLIIPIVAMPSVLRAPIFYLSRAITSRSRLFRICPTFRQWHKMPTTSSENGPVVEKDTPGGRLANLFASDSITGTLCTYLHVDDVANVAKTSKAMREAVFVTTHTKRHGNHASSDSSETEDRLDLICRTACTPGEKEQCWVCMKVICSVSDLLPPSLRGAEIAADQAWLFSPFLAGMQCKI